MTVKKIKGRNALEELGADNLKSRLRFYMRQSGFNPTNLSKKAGLNSTAVRDILEHPGTPNPRIDTFIKLCRTLGINPAQLSPDMEILCKDSHTRKEDEQPGDINPPGTN